MQGILLILCVGLLLFAAGLAYASYQNDIQNKPIYWSNCLIEAVRHWLMDPSGTKIMYCPASWNEVFCPHWMWRDRDGIEYDFNTREKLQPWQYIWFKGGVRVHKRGTYGRYVNELLAAKYYGGRMPA